MIPRPWPQQLSQKMRYMGKTELQLKIKRSTHCVPLPLKLRVTEAVRGYVVYVFYEALRSIRSSAYSSLHYEVLRSIVYWPADLSDKVRTIQW